MLLVGTSVDLSEEIRLFIAILDSKRNKNDENVKWTVISMKKIDVAKSMGVYPAN